MLRAQQMKLLLNRQIDPHAMFVLRRGCVGGDELIEIAQPLLDEPLGALDALTRISMQRLLERIWREQGFTALLVTHDVAEALTLADRVLVIEEGIVKHDLRVDIPRPRQRGSADIAALEGKILQILFDRSE